MGNCFIRRAPSRKLPKQTEYTFDYELAECARTGRVAEMRAKCDKLDPAEPIYLQVAMLCDDNRAVLHLLLHTLRFDVDALDPNGDQLVFACALLGHFKNLDFLLYFGANLARVNLNGWSLFHKLMFTPHYAMQAIKALQFGADPEFSALRNRLIVPPFHFNREQFCYTKVEVDREFQTFMLKHFDDNQCRVCRLDCTESLRGVCGFCVL